LPVFLIIESVVSKVEAPSADEALEAHLQGQSAFFAVTDRQVEPEAEAGRQVE
jgi:hypothetical protein